MPERDITATNPINKAHHEIKIRAGGLPKRTQADLNQNAIDYVQIAKRVAQETTHQYRRDKLIQDHQLDRDDPPTNQILDEIDEMANSATVHQFLPIIAAKKIKKFKADSGGK